jgi:hemoglobin
MCHIGLRLVLALIVIPGFARAALYDDLGGQSGVQAIVDGAVQHWLADPRIAPTFAETNMDRFRRLLNEQFCQIADGPCKYTGRTMAAVHHPLGLDRAQFNALAEDLQDAMTDIGVAYHTQNRLIARLAPMQREIVAK